MRGFKVVLVALLLVAVPATGQSGKLPIRGATVIDGTGGAALAEAVVVVEGERIVAVGPMAEVPIPEGAKIIEGKGKYIDNSMRMVKPQVMRNTLCCKKHRRMAHHYSFGIAGTSRSINECRKIVRDDYTLVCYRFSLPDCRQ